LLSFAEILRLVRLLAGMGVNKVRLTGGEPLLREDIEHLVAELAIIPGIKTLGLTTNGVLLQERLRALKEAGLSLLNVSLDTLRPERFEKITLHNHYHRVRQNLEAAIEAGFSPLKLNTVIVKGFNEDEILDFVELARARPLNVRFIEYMPFDSNLWRYEDFVSCRQVRKLIERKYTLIPLERDLHAPDVAREYRIKGFRGTIGFIAPLSDQFCRNRNRLRLTADGCLKLCLHHQLEIDLAEPLRSGASDAELERIIRTGLKNKPAGHRAFEAVGAKGGRSMRQLGG